MSTRVSFVAHIHSASLSDHHSMEIRPYCESLHTCIVRTYGMVSDVIRRNNCLPTCVQPRPRELWSCEEGPTPRERDHACGENTEMQQSPLSSSVNGRGWAGSATYEKPCTCMYYGSFTYRCAQVMLSAVHRAPR